MLKNILAAAPAPGGNGVGDYVNQAMITESVKWIAIIILTIFGLGVMASAIGGTPKWGKIGTKVAIILIGASFVAGAVIWWKVGASVGKNIGA